MRSHLRPRPVVLLAGLLLLGSLNSLGLAQSDSRAVLAARQRVRGDLAAAMADGSLSRMEQYDILLQAKQSLPASDVAALQETLNRLGGLQEASEAGANRKTIASRLAADSESDQTDTESSTAQAVFTRTEKDRFTETASFDEAAAGETEGSPFQEEDAAPTDALPDDGEYLPLDMEDGMVLDEMDCGFFDVCATRGGICHDIRLAAGIDAFKGPMDLDNANGNFGTSFAVNGGFLVAPRMGIGVQAGSSAVLSDFHGTRFTDDKIRTQNFTTVGLYQRVPVGAQRLKWGFAFDWLWDDYYDQIRLGQWRVKMGYDLNCFNEVGIWAVIPNNSSHVRVPDVGGQFHIERFEPLAQGNFYLRHLWPNGGETTCWVGMVEEPGQFRFGADGRIPLTSRLAMVGNFNYVLPDARGATGQDEEMWQVSVGVEFTPFVRDDACGKPWYAPLFPLANNGTFAVRRFR